MTEAQASHRTASQSLRELMREFAQLQAQEYDNFLLHKVQTAHTSMQADLGVFNDEVEAQFSQWRAKVAGLS